MIWRETMCPCERCVSMAFALFPDTQRCYYRVKDGDYSMLWDRPTGYYEMLKSDENGKGFVNLEHARPLELHEIAIIQLERGA